MGGGFSNIMNVKISEDSVTFKITEEEMKHLLTGSALEKKILIGQSDFVMVIDPNPHEYFEDFKEAPLKLILDRAESCLMLCTTIDEIRKLSEIGRSREGLSAHIGGIDVFLQVDVRKDSRPRQNR
jgi:hypothetical protein